MLPVLFKPKKCIRYAGVYTMHDIEGFPRCRSNEEIRRMFEEWIVLFGKVAKCMLMAEEKETRYDIFKGKVRFIEENDGYSTNRKLGLDYFSDMTTKEYFTMKAEEETKMRAASEDKDESSNKSPSPYLKLTEIYLEDFLSMRNDMEILAMFYTWCVDHQKTYCSDAEKMKRFKCFKFTVKFIEETNAKISESDSRLLLSSFAHWTARKFFSLCGAFDVIHNWKGKIVQHI